jgi:hypothetical protein
MARSGAAAEDVAFRSSMRGWLRFWGDLGGESRYRLIQNRRFLGPKYRVIVHNFDPRGSLAHLDTAVHEGFHAFIGRHVPSIFDTGNLRFCGIPIRAPVKYIEETFAYGFGHLAAGRVHGTLFAPIEVFLSGSLTRNEKAVTLISGGVLGGGYWLSHWWRE